MNQSLDSCREGGWRGLVGGVTYRVLVGVETAVVEAAIGAAEAQRMRRSGAVISPGIGEIDIVCAEVLVAERSIIRHGEARRPRARQTSIERGGHSQHAGEDVVDAFAGVVLVGRRPGDGDLVLGRVRGAISLAEESDGPRTGDVHLLLVRAGQDEDGLVGVVVGEGLNGCLDGGEVGGLVRGGDLDCALGAVVAIGLAGLAGDVVEGDAVDAGGVPQEREERGDVEAKHGPTWLIRSART